MALNRDQVLQRRSVATEVVPAPELGDGATLKVRRLSAAEFLSLSEKVKPDPKTAYIHWIGACTVDDDDQPLFSADDAQIISELPYMLVERLIDASQRLNIAAKQTSGPNPQPQPDASPTS